MKPMKTDKVSENVIWSNLYVKKLFNTSVSFKSNIIINSVGIRLISFKMEIIYLCMNVCRIFVTSQMWSSQMTT